MSNETEGYNWTSIIDQAVDAWPEPTPIPTGHWHLKVKSGKIDKSKGRAMIALAPVAPMDDVDADEVAKLNGELESTTVFASFNMARQDDVTRLKQLVKSLGLGEFGLEDALKGMKGADTAGEIVHTPKNDGTDGVYINIRRLGAFAG